MTNHDLAEQLRCLAHEAASQPQGLYRARAYRRAAFVVSGWPAELVSLVQQQGEEGLAMVPGLGPSLRKKLADAILEDHTAC